MIDKSERLNEGLLSEKAGAYDEVVFVSVLLGRKVVGCRMCVYKVWGRAVY